MTYLEIDEAFVEITRQKCAECKARLDSVPQENTMERKALQIEYGMYTYCGNAGLLFNTGWERTKVIRVRQRFLKDAIAKYPKLHKIYNSLAEEEKLCFIAALQMEVFLRHHWLGAQYAELAAAKASGNAGKVFEFTIKTGATRNMFVAWENWRKENGIYPGMFQEDAAG